MVFFRFFKNVPSSRIGELQLKSKSLKLKNARGELFGDGCGAFFTKLPLGWGKRDVTGVNKKLGENGGFSPSTSRNFSWVLTFFFFFFV